MLCTNHFLENVGHFFYVFSICKCSSNLECCPFFFLSNYCRGLSIFYFLCGDCSHYNLKPTCCTNNPLGRFSPGTMANEIDLLFPNGLLGCFTREGDLNWLDLWLLGVREQPSLTTIWPEGRHLRVTLQGLTFLKPIRESLPRTIYFLLAKWNLKLFKSAINHRMERSPHSPYQKWKNTAPWN